MKIAQPFAGKKRQGFVRCGLVLALTMAVSIACSYSTPSAQRIIIAGKVVNTRTGEWPNNRLVLLFLKGKEVARGTTATSTFFESNEGVVDGIFYVEVDNPYQLSEDSFKVGENDSGFVYKQISEWKGIQYNYATFLYRKFDTIDEGSIVYMPVPSKNIQYILKVLEGDISTLPPEILRYPAEFKANNTIVVSLGDANSEQVSASDANVQNIYYNTGTQMVEINKITVPINNCGGSAPVSQRYIQTQTFIHEYRQDLEAGLGVEIPLKFVSLIPKLQVHYGFAQGQINSQTVEYNMAAESGTNQVYTISWKEAWEQGTVEIASKTDVVTVPFRAKTNLIYEINSQSLRCN